MSFNLAGQGTSGSETFKNAFDDGFFSLAFLSIHSLSKLELKLTLIHYGQRQPSFSIVYGLIILLSD